MTISVLISCGISVWFVFNLKFTSKYKKLPVDPKLLYVIYWTAKGLNNLNIQAENAKFIYLHSFWKEIFLYVATHE